MTPALPLAPLFIYFDPDLADVVSGNLTAALSAHKPLLTRQSCPKLGHFNHLAVEFPGLIQQTLGEIGKRTAVDVLKCTPTLWFYHRVLEDSNATMM